MLYTNSSALETPAFDYSSGKMKRDLMLYTLMSALPINVLFLSSKENTSVF